jgi:uncharacterized SAM-binding protein YcdF (DUF218 family)
MMPMSEILKKGQELRESADFVYDYDAVIVLSGGLQKTGDTYYPTDYRHADGFGMLGGGMRMVAALDLYLNKQARNFVFATGVTEKNIEKFGPDVPPESSVYAEKFLRSVQALGKRSDFSEKFVDLSEPVIVEENRSTNTASHFPEIFRILSQHNWHNVAILSSEYHIPRVEQLYQQALALEPVLTLSPVFIRAEEYVKKVEPGKYDAVINQWTNPASNSAAAMRHVNEANGLAAMKKGQYHLGEFQLKDSSE